MMSSLESTSPVEESEEVALRIREQMMLEKVAQKYHLEARVDVEELFDEVDYAQVKRSTIPVNLRIVSLPKV